jgi:hypothetical protein
LLGTIKSSKSSDSPHCIVPVDAASKKSKMEKKSEFTKRIYCARYASDPTRHEIEDLSRSKFIDISYVG